MENLPRRVEAVIAKGGPIPTPTIKPYVSVKADIPKLLTI